MFQNCIVLLLPMYPQTHRKWSEEALLQWCRHSCVTWKHQEQCSWMSSCRRRKCQSEGAIMVPCVWPDGGPCSSRAAPQHVGVWAMSSWKAVRPAIGQRSRPRKPHRRTLMGCGGEAREWLKPEEEGSLSDCRVRKLEGRVLKKETLSGLIQGQIKSHRV